MSDLRQLYVRLRSSTTGHDFAPPELRERIVAEAEREGSNLNDVVVARLARRYGVPFAPKGRRAHPTVDDEVLALRVPAALRAAIDRAALDADRNAQDETVAALCEDYGLEFVPARKRNGPKRVVAAA